MSTTEEITRVLNGFGLHADTHRWAKFEALLAPTVTVDYTSLVGGTAHAESASAFVERWKKLLPAFTCVQHLITNHLIEAEGDSATAETQVATLHTLKDPKLGGNDAWTFGGRYDFRLKRIDGHWRIEAVKLTVTRQSGNLDLMKHAQARAASA